MSGISIGHSHPRPCSGEKTLRRCRNNEEADNVILIDVDSENFDNVIIIDVPESLPKKRQGSSMLRKDKKWSFRNVIYIDDDETPDSYHSIGVNNVSFSAGTSSNRESCHVAKNFTDSADAAFEGCQFVQDNATPVRLSKCKRTYSGKASTRNRYGLNTDSESDSSDDDYPDCELVEDSSGKVQELWEKAFSRRRKDIHNGHSEDHDSTSRDIDGDHHQNDETKDATRQHKEASFGFNTGKFNNDNDAPSRFRTKEDTDFGCSPLFDVAVERSECEPGSSSCHVGEKAEYPASSNSAFPKQSTKEFDHPIPAFEEEETSKVETCPPKFESCVDEDFCYGKSSPLDDEAAICTSKILFETKVKPGRSFPGDDHKNFPETATGSVKEREHLESGLPHATGDAKEMENLMPESCSFKRSTLPHKQTDHSSTPSCDAVGSVSGKSSFSKDFLGSGDDIEKGYHQENSQLVPEVLLAKLREDISVSNIQKEEDKDGQLHSQNGDTLPSVDTCIINEREKLKETDEYKRAIEEEWASRQQALLIQAEEAQRLRRLRRRRKAESMRLLDMERRQKQRVEEMRNIQKKDEENMNLKEKIRAEVRKELKKLEVTCHNMASLLHLLGIRVGGWPNPLPQEVQTAYKRALLTFHPDRASQSDVRQQVEAEEKFKLINRLKEKFSPSL